MADSGQPVNRKQRRAAAREAARNPKHLDNNVPNIKMAYPDRSGPKAKTLYEIAEERQALLNKGKPFPKQEGPDKDGDWEFNDEPLGPAGDAVLYAATLSMLHLTLDVLVRSQYRQEVVWKAVFGQLAKVFPILFLVVYMLHSETAARFSTSKQLFFLAVSISAGCYMVFSGNMHGYYAVMKRAPPVGVVWVWSVIEMRLPFAVASVIAVAGYLWWNGFSAF